LGHTDNSHNINKEFSLFLFTFCYETKNNNGVLPPCRDHCRFPFVFLRSIHSESSTDRCFVIGVRRQCLWSCVLRDATPRLIVSTHICAMVIPVGVTAVAGENGLMDDFWLDRSLVNSYSRCHDRAFELPRPAPSDAESLRPNKNEEVAPNATCSLSCSRWSRKVLDRTMPHVC
jgi:hypothetical protein